MNASINEMKVVEEAHKAREKKHQSMQRDSTVDES
jgi:hypothetical protein